MCQDAVNRSAADKKREQDNTAYPCVGVHLCDRVYRSQTHGAMMVYRHRRDFAMPGFRKVNKLYIPQKGRQKREGEMCLQFSK